MNNCAHWNVYKSFNYASICPLLSIDLEFTVVVPSVDISTINKDRLKEFIFEHLIPGKAFTTFNEEDLYGNTNNHLIKFTHLNKYNESIWALNDLKILRTAVLNKQCSVIYIDGVLGDKRTLFSKRNIHDNNRYGILHLKEKRNIHAITFMLQLQ